MSMSARLLRPLFPLLSLVCLLAGCLPPAAPAEPQPLSLRVGVALYKQDDTFISTILNHFEQAAKERETAGDLKITINTADGKGSQTLQNDQIDRFIAQSYDVICVNTVDRTAAAVIIDKAKSAGIPLVFFNREPVEEDLQRWNRVYYVGGEASQSGMLQGQIVVDRYSADPASVDLDGDGVLQYVMLEGENNHQDTLLRTEFSIKAVGAAGIKTEKLANDTANWQRGQASARMSQWIPLFGERIEVVFCNNDDMALGALDALQTAGVDPLPLVVGIDATPPALEAIRAGILAGTVLNDSDGQARAMLDICCALIKGRDPGEAVPFKQEKYLRLPYRVVTAQTLAGPDEN